MGKPVSAGVPSPCVSVCAIDEVTGLCTGCLRTIDEIAAWSVLDDDERRDVWARIGARRAASAPRGPRSAAEG
jgi:predicted Fe-S protein YdhL (DUF1289 family)